MYFNLWGDAWMYKIVKWTLANILRIKFVLNFFGESTVLYNYYQSVYIRMRTKFGHVYIKDSFISSKLII
jgi:hypothetical protein